MSWTCRLSKKSADVLRGLPKKHQRQLARAIEEMTGDPMLGDVQPIKSGKFKGVLRKRVGRYRFVFAVEPDQRLVEIAAILARSETTYR